MPSPSLSVIVRTRARPARLAEALASLARQTFRQFEAVVVDMGDEANWSVVEQASAGLPSVQHLVVSPSLSRPGALNYGIERAEGALFGVLDDDNLYEPEHLSNLVNGIASTGGELVYTGTRRETYTPEGDLVHVESIHQTPFDYARLLMENFIYATSMACRRRLWERVGGYDTRFPVYEDWDFLIRCAAIGRVEPVAGFTAVSRSFTGRPDMPEHHREVDDCRRCAIGVLWVHRATRRRVLGRRPDLIGPHHPLHRHGVHAVEMPVLRDWWTRSRAAGLTKPPPWAS